MNNSAIKFMRLISLLALLLLTITTNSHAKSLDDSVDELCEKVKICGQAKIAEQSIPPEMALLIEGLFNGMCQSLAQPYMAKATNANLQDKAVACIETINKQSCSDIIESEGSSARATPACETFEAAVNNAYPNGIDAEQ